MKYWFATGPVDTCGKYFVFDSMLSNHLDTDTAHFDPVSLVRWFPKPERLKYAENFLIPCNDNNVHWLLLDVVLARDAGTEAIVLFNSMQGDVHPEVKYRNVVRNLNVLLDLSVLKLAGWTGGRPGVDRVVTPFAHMTHQEDGVSCGVFLMLLLAQRTMSKSCRQYTHFDMVSLFLMMKLCKYYALIGLEKIRDRSAPEVLLYHITCVPVMGDVMQFCLSEVGQDPFRFPGNNPGKVPRKFQEDWGSTSVYTLSSRRRCSLTWNDDTTEYQTFKNGKVHMRSVFEDTRPGNTRRVEHGFQGSSRKIPTQVYSSDHADVFNISVTVCEIDMC